jgi:hypothetical protein
MNTGGKGSLREGADCSDNCSGGACTGPIVSVNFEAKRNSCAAQELAEQLPETDEMLEELRGAARVLAQLHNPYLCHCCDRPWSLFSSPRSRKT